LSCCDLFGNAGGDYVGRIGGQIGIDGNFSADPAFCDTLNGDFTLGDCSPCLPGNHPDGYDCGGIIGAWAALAPEAPIPSRQDNHVGAYYIILIRDMLTTGMKRRIV
jgi:hypothetical protein